LSAIAGYHRYTKSDPAFQPPCLTRYLTLPRRFSQIYEALRRKLPEVACRILEHSIRRMLTKLHASVVLAAFPFDDFVVASFSAAHKMGLPFYVHMHDLWVENTSAGSRAAQFAEKWEPVILQGAKRVLCMTEAMQHHYAEKYGIRTDLLPHCVAERDYLNAPVGLLPTRTPKLTVLFTGAVSPQMNLDALKVLARASELLPQEFELLYCTSLEFPALVSLGIHSSRLQVRYVSREEVKRLQSMAHVLVAPLSHKNCSIDEVRTVFSTKLLEYLVSGRPIIIFAPEGSYHAESARKNGWGYVVTEDSPATLAAAIVKVGTDEALAADLVRGALREARTRSAKPYAERLRKWVVEDVRAAQSLEGIGEDSREALLKESRVSADKILMKN
jgi:glycosyltransferase involved in cell wall biosynthesis